MYFILSYDIMPELKSDKSILANEVFKHALGDLKWVKPLSNLFIVKCIEEERYSIYLKLSEYVKNNPGKARFIITPLIDEGELFGYLDETLWPYIKDITKDDLDGIFG